MGRTHPIWGLLREQGRYNLVWLAGRTGYSHSHVKAMASGRMPCSPRFRAACAALLGLGEGDLFHAGDGSVGPPAKEGELGRSATAVRDALYPRREVRSISQPA